MTIYGRPGVYVSERLLPAPLAATATANAAGACIGKFAKGPETVTLVTSWYDFVQKFGGYSNSYPATFGVGSFFQNGGSELYVRRVLSSDESTTGAEGEIVSGSSLVAIVSSKNRGSEANLIRVQLSSTGRAGYYNFTVFLEGGASASDSVASNDIIVEQFSNVLFNNPVSSDYIETVVNGNSQYVNIDVDSVNSNLTPSFSRVPLTGGNDGDDPLSTDYEAAVADFSVVDRPLVLFAPEINAQGIVDSEDDPAAANVIDTMIEWAEANNGFVVADTAEALTSAGAPALTVANAITYAGARQTSSHAAVYYPNIYISDPLGRSSSALRKIGPAGAIAGLYIFTDKQAGPFKAPAGLRATIRGAVGVEKQFTSAELDLLNAGVTGSPVNALRNLPGAGIVAMGARTLLQDGTANKYVNTRRSLIFLRKSLSDLTQFALFENNDSKLWARIRSSVGVFLTGYLNQGGLRGDVPAQAFYVKCDAENNPQANVLNSEVNIEVGVALQYPAEFVVITLSQNTSA
jgi:phage tail sheath protein FI